jgi:S1-C subfamily serine protease
VRNGAWDVAGRGAERRVVGCVSSRRSFSCSWSARSGQSGGPAINAAGEVVMMVQRTTSAVGIGVGAETIRARMGRYFEKPKPQP